MIRNLLVKWAILAVAIGVTIYFVPGIGIEGGIWQLFLVALVFGLITAVLGPILKVLTLPLMAATLGLFSLVINFALFLLTAWIMPNLKIDGLWPAFLASLIISIVAGILGALFRDK